MNSKTLAGLITTALVAAPLAANAASVTYNFTGTVTSSSGIYSTTTAGTAVTGTYTINLGNATGSSGTVGSTSSDWTALEQTGSFYGNTPSSAYVFSDSVSGGTFFYNTPAPGTYASWTFVAGYNASDAYTGYEEQYTSGTSPTTGDTGVQSSFTLVNPSSAAFASPGLPLSFASPPSGATDTGYVNALNAGSQIGALNYTITSLTAATVPLPAAAWLMFSGLAGLVFVARRRKEGTGFVAA